MGKGRRVYKAPEFIKAIEGSGGIISTIAKRMGCNRQTVYNAMKKYSTVAKAIDEERENFTDEAEFGLVHNIRTRNKDAEQDKKPIDTADHKWWLSRKRPKDFGDKIDITSGDKPLSDVSEDQIAGYIERLTEITGILANPSRIHSGEQGSEETNP